MTPCCARAVVVSARLGFAATAGPAGRSIVERTVVNMLAFRSLAILDIDCACIQNCDCGQSTKLQNIPVSALGFMMGFAQDAPCMFHAISNRLESNVAMRQSTVLRWLLVINIVGLSVLLAFVFDVESQLEAVLDWIARHSWLGASLFIVIYAASTGALPS